MKVALLALVLQAAAPSQESPVDPALEWNHHLGAAFRKAIEKKEQIVVFFSTKTCVWCRKLQEETFRDPKVKALLARRVLVHLDLEEAAEIGSALGAQAVPDVRLYSEDGLPLARQTGFLPAEPFLAWLSAGAAGKPLENETSLKALRLDSALDAYFDLDAKGKPLPDDKLDPLLLLAAGSPGETRTESLRLIRKWAPASSPGLVKALEHPKLKIRLAAYEALAEIGAPLGRIDPWAGPAAASAELQTWLKARPAAPSVTVPHPVENSWTPALEADLLAFEDEKGARNAAARERLISGGPGLVARFRDRSRSLRGTAPATAARLDEIRFRILLTPGVLRRVPDAAARLAVGSAGERSLALEDILKRYPSGLEGLVHEAACDPDPLFRETSAAFMRPILGPAARDALADLLKDPEANVRAAALREMASIPAKGTAEAIRDYLTREKDPDMVGHAVRSLQEVPTATSKEVLRSLLQSPHWAVRGAAVKALMELRDYDSLGSIQELLKDPDEFVVGQALAALAKMLERFENADASGLVDRIGELMEAQPQLVRAAIKTLSVEKLRRLKKTDAILRKWARHPDGSVRAAAIASLAADRERPAFEEVREALFDKDPLVRAAGAEGLRSLVDTKELRSLLSDSKPPDAYADCRSPLLAGLGDAALDVRLECALTLLYYGDLKEASPAWKSFLVHRDPTIRKRAMEGLRWIGPKEVLRSIVLEFWAAAPKEERDVLLTELAGGEREVDSFDLLIELLPKLEGADLRGWADALVHGGVGNDFRLDDPVFIKRSKEFAKSLARAAEGLSEEYQRVLEVLSESIDPRKDEAALRSGLKSPHALLRRSALTILLRQNVRLSSADLEPLVRDPEPKIRALALVGCLPRRDRHRFSDISQDWLGGKAQRYWYGSTGYSDDTKIVQLPEALLNERLEDADPEVRLRAAALMTLEGSDEALAYIHRVWRESGGQDVRELLVRGVIGAWEDKYTSILEEVLESYRPTDTYYFRNLYSMVRPLKGPLIQKFRSKLLMEYHVGD